MWQRSKKELKQLFILSIVGIIALTGIAILFKQPYMIPAIIVMVCLSINGYFRYRNAP